MKKKVIDHIILHHKWPVTIGELWNRYDILLLPLFFVFASVVVIINTGLKTDGSIPQTSLITFIVVFVLIGLASGWYFFTRLRKERLFHAVPVTMDQRLKLTEHIESIGWVVFEKNNDFIRAGTKVTWTSWGDKITIVLCEKQVLFNSRPFVLMPLFYDRDQVNLKLFTDFSS